MTETTSLLLAKKLPWLHGGAPLPPAIMRIAQTVIDTTDTQRHALTCALPKCVTHIKSDICGNPGPYSGGEDRTQSVRLEEGLA